MAVRTCHNCVYARVDSEQWLRCQATGEPLLLRCANHPLWPGQLREVPGTPCSNYRPKPAEPGGAVKRIPLGNGQYALVDGADYEWLSQWIWHGEDGYAVRCEKGKRIYMHRQITNPPDGMSVDHVNRCRADNRRTNLRLCTHRQNMYNRAKRAGSISRFKGVGFRKRDQKWYAELGAAAKPIWLGFFDEEIEAARAYDFKAVEHFGEFACVNFPEEWPPERRAEVHAQRAEKGEERERAGRNKSKSKTKAKVSCRGE